MPCRLFAFIACSVIVVLFILSFVNVCSNNLSIHVLLLLFTSQYACLSAVVRKMYYLSMSLNKVTNVSPFECFRFLNIAVSVVTANRKIVLIMTTMTL